MAKMRDIVEAYDPESADSESLVPAVSCLVNLAVDTEYWGQAELKAERAMDPVRRAFERGVARVEVCAGVRRVLARVRQEQSRQRLRSHGERRATCVGVPPPARPRGGERKTDAPPKRRWSRWARRRRLTTARAG